MNQPLSRYVDYMYSYPHKTAYRPFPAPVSLLPYLEQLQGRKASLYFHIPFCSHKCGYCNLFSLQTNRTEYIATYLDTLHRQAQQLSPLTAGLTFDSFAIGGGTPLLLTVPQLEQLMATAALFGVHPSHAFTSVETSPEYADRPRLNVLKKAGVSRVSIGIQSFQDEELKAIKRRPRQNTIYQALDDIRQMDFPYFNIDLIYGIKGQTVESFLYSLEEALRFQPNELFIYPLYVRQGTGITEREPDDVCFRMYRAACKLLQAKGFLQTSMRRFIHHPSTDAEVSCGDEVMLSCGSGGRSYGWISLQEFTDIVAISQMTPGPIGINSATYIGYTAVHNAGYSETMSILGSCLTTFAVCLPSFLLVLLISYFFAKFRNNKYVEAAFLGLRPATVGLIAAAALLLMNKENFIDYKSFLIFGAAFILTWKFKVHPILMIILAGIAGIILYW